MSVQIDGKKFVAALGFNEETVTVLKIKEVLTTLSEDERKKLFEDCVIITPEEVDRPTLLSQELAFKQVEYIGNLPAKLINDVEVKRRLKYEKNYLAQRELRHQLGPDIGERGKHSKGCKRKRRK